MVAYLSAAGLCMLIACVHTFIGSRTDVIPLLNSDTPEPAKSTLYYCWHLVTITLFAMAALYVWSANAPHETSPAIVATGFAVAFSLWGFLAAIVRGQSAITQLPQGMLFLLPAACGLWGLAAG